MRMQGIKKPWPADLCFAKQKKPELLRKNEPRNSNSKRIASFVLREVDQKRKHARTHAYTHTLIHTRTHTCTKRCCLYKCYFHWVIFDVDFHMKWPDGIEQFSTQNIYGHIFFTITKTHNRYYKIYIIEMHSRFWFSFVIEKRKKKEKKNYTFQQRSLYLESRRKISLEGAPFWVSQTLSASKLTRWPLNPLSIYPILVGLSRAQSATSGYTGLARF